MNGAESLVDTLAGAGITACFANPGTSEMHFVAALDRAPSLRAVLCLFEGVATGAADGFARMAQRPAATLLHLGPGLGNGLANLHNAKKAQSPVVNIVGDHALSHQRYDSPLSSDLAAIARPVSHWVHTSASSRTVATDAARAVAVARSHPGQIATLLLPADTAWEAADGPAPAVAVAPPAAPDPAAIDRAAAALRRDGAGATLLIRGAGLSAAGLDLAGRIRAATGVRVMCDTFAPRFARGAGISPVEKIPYFAEMIVDTFKDCQSLVLVGASPPVAFFAYPGKPSWCLPEACAQIYAAHPHEDAMAALALLADAVGASDSALPPPLVRPDRASGSLNAWTIGQAIARHLPEGAVLVDESATASLGLWGPLAGAPPHETLTLTGGSIGQGLPCAVGAAVAAPERKILAVQGDGGAMYTLQALWTMAREQLDVVTVIVANRSYAILNVELARVGAGNPGPKTLSLFDLTNPTLDWTALASGMGVEASRADSAESFDDQLADAMARRGPRLIEAVI